MPGRYITVRALSAAYKPAKSPEPGLSALWRGCAAGHDPGLRRTHNSAPVNPPSTSESQNGRGWKGPLWVI